MNKRQMHLTQPRKVKVAISMRQIYKIWKEKCLKNMEQHIKTLMTQIQTSNKNFRLIEIPNKMQRKSASPNKNC